MKKVTYEYGCRALGYFKGEFFVPEDTSDEEIQKMIDETADFSSWFKTEDGYEEQTEIVYRKVQ